ncbi:MAG: hypothetical protein EP332_00470 [Bacteroidetes bacterium]|nr:MAG: hypothetical protein EP332_00470 [Bacteroidota bacterium]
MKKNFIYALAAFSMLAACKPEVKEVEEPKATEDLSFYVKQVQTALDRKDIPTALVNLNYVLGKDSTRQGLRDTLFFLYTEMQNTYGMANVGAEILKYRPNDLTILEPTAEAMKLNGEFGLAINIQEHIFGLTSDPRVKLMVAESYAYQQNIDKAEENIRWVIDNFSGKDTIKIERPMVSEQNRTQKIKMTAVAHQYLAQIYAETGQKAKALSELDKALAIEPYYDLALVMKNELKFGKKRR